MIKVKALDTYKRLNVKDKNVGRVLPIGYEMLIDEERYGVLTGNNKYNEAFVEPIEPIKISNKKKKANRGSEEIPVPKDPTLTDK